MEDIDWDLQAVVRGYTSSNTTTAATRTNSNFMTDLKHDSSSSSCSIHNFVSEKKDDSLLWFPDSSLFNEPRRSFVEELHELYKPFFPKSAPSSLQIQRGSINHHHHQQQLKQSRTVSTNTTTTIHSQSASRSKRRKNQMKKVFQVPAEGLASDTWSWRKYGQKPIKGSPYPRGYYRCSSSKGCLARKQVERNRTDPTMFIITYTAEHNHPVPTHRNSLAGTTRLQKQPSSPPSSSSSIAVESSSNNNNNPLTTTTTAKPSSCSSDEISLQQNVVKMENRVELDGGDEDCGEDDDDELAFSDMAMSDDFFDGLDEIVGPVAVTGDFFSDNNVPGSFVIPWMANNAAAAAGSS